MTVKLITDKFGYELIPGLDKLTALAFAGDVVFIRIKIYFKKKYSW